MNKEQEIIFHKLLEKFNIKQEDYLRHKKYYNNSFEEYGNDIYTNILTRLVHLDNFSDKENWFNKRYDLLFKEYSNFDIIIEAGFSLPYIPLSFKDLNSQNLPKLIYVDIYDSAIKVSKEILNLLNFNADFINADIEGDIKNIKLDPKLMEKSLFVAIETLEHLSNPDVFWKNISKINLSKVMVSLPVGPKIPSHNLYFLTVNQARAYLKKYIDIEEELIIGPNNSTDKGIDKYQDIIVVGKLH